MRRYTLGGQVLLGDVMYGTNPKGLVAAEFSTGKMHWRAEGIGPGAVLYAGGSPLLPRRERRCRAGGGDA